MPDHAPVLYVVVLNWNNPADTLLCLRHLVQSRYPHMRPVVVDNGSTDDSVAQIRAAFPQIPLLQTGANLGYAGGNNQGIRYSLEQGAAYVVLLNNDAFVAPDALGHLVAAAERDPTIAAAGCKVPLYAEPRRLWAAGEVFPFGCSPLDDGAFDTPCDIEYAAGCCILLRRAALARVGLFDPDFFCYFEEYDWCLRATDAGYRIVYVPEAVVYHRVAASAGAASPLYYYFYVRNYLAMSARHGRVHTGGLWRVHDALLVWFREVARIVAYPGTAHMRRIWAATYGAVDFLRGRLGAPPRVL
jgi:hypothetical protein